MCKGSVRAGKLILLPVLRSGADAEEWHRLPLAQSVSVGYLKGRNETQRERFIVGSNIPSPIVVGPD
jgi:hypothetical protein